MAENGRKKKPALILPRDFQRRLVKSSRLRERTRPLIYIGQLCSQNKTFSETMDDSRCRGGAVTVNNKAACNIY